MTGNVAIIPARGGSKRLPRKNILPFLGRPIIQYTIEAAGRCGLFESVIVSTEDAEIQETVQELECEIHRRPLDLASDTARVVDVLREVLAEQRNQGREFDFLCCLYPTAPLRSAADIRAAYERMASRGADYCLAIKDYEDSPFFAFDLKADGRIERRWPELAALQHWEKPRVAVDNGSMYWARVSAFLASGELVGPKAVGYPMPRWRSVDIEEREDLEIAEFFARRHLP